MVSIASQNMCHGKFWMFVNFSLDDQYYAILCWTCFLQHDQAKVVWALYSSSQWHNFPINSKCLSPPLGSLKEPLPVPVKNQEFYSPPKFTILHGGHKCHFRLGVEAAGRRVFNDSLSFYCYARNAPAYITH